MSEMANSGGGDCPAPAAAAAAAEAEQRNGSSEQHAMSAAAAVSAAPSPPASSHMQPPPGVVRKPAKAMQQHLVSQSMHFRTVLASYLGISLSNYQETKFFGFSLLRYCLNNKGFI